MLYDIKGVKVATIGDVHLGRKFVTGVPLERRGEREEMVFNQFQAEMLNPDNARVVVQMGDLYDKFIVPLELIIQTVNFIRIAASAAPEVTFVFLRGNHDASKDLTKVSAFELTTLLLADVKNVKFVTGTMYLDVAIDATWSRTLGFVGWDPLVSAATQVGFLPPCAAVFGHWDTKAFGEDTHNLLPQPELAQITKRVFTGHVHKPENFYYSINPEPGRPVRGETEAVHVVVTGSMQPYAHGEEAEPDMYRTVTVDELQALGDVRMRCIRVLLKKGEAIPAAPDCLQFTVKREGDPEDGETTEVEMSGFDMEKLFIDSFAEADVDGPTTALMLERFKELRVS